jgi:integrase
MSGSGLISSRLRGVAIAYAGPLVPYDGRRTFSHWLEVAKIDEARIETYMGHEIKDVRMAYRRGSKEFVRPYLAQDLAALLALPGMAAA